MAGYYTEVLPPRPTYHITWYCLLIRNSHALGLCSESFPANRVIRGMVNSHAIELIYRHSFDRQDSPPCPLVLDVDEGVCNINGNMFYLVYLGHNRNMFVLSSLIDSAFGRPPHGTLWARGLFHHHWGQHCHPRPATSRTPPMTAAGYR